MLREILYATGRQTRKAWETLKAYTDRIRLLSRLDEFDAVFVYREAALLWIRFLEKRVARRKPIIYQLDDPLFVPYRSPANGYLSYLKFFGKVKEIIKMSRVVMVNSTHIRAYAEQFNKNVWQVPSVVDIDRFVYRESDQLRLPICVGWSGSPTTIKNLKMIERPLAQISANENCDIRLIGSREFRASGCEIRTQDMEQRDRSR